MMGQRAKSGFLANITHEIRTPLHAIIANSQLLADSALSLRQKKQINDIVHSGEALLQMFDDMIQLTTLDSSVYSPNHTHAELGAWLSQICNAGKAYLGEKELGFSITFHPCQKFHVTGDLEILKKILLHLIVNSFKFTEQGEVSLDVEMISPKKIRLELRDTGRGLLADKSTSLFEPFWQESDQSDKATQGAGLGLAVAKKLCSIIGASLTLTSEKNRGTSFVLEFPLDNIELREVFVPTSFKGRRVAIISSHFMERQSLAFALNMFGCEIVYNGERPDRWETILSRSEKIYISSSELYRKGKWDEELFGYLDAMKDRTTVIYYQHEDSALIRKFARLGYAYHLPRPIITTSLISDEASRDDQSVGGEQKKVLLVDDEADFLILLEEAIEENLSLQVMKAKSGQEGFDILTTKDVDIIVLDIEMNGISGIEFFNRMQAMGIDLPVLFLSAHYLDEDLLNNLDGRYLYRDKYSGIEEIVRSVNSLLLDRGDKPKQTSICDLPKVLVVDDSDVNTSLIELMLRDAGYPLSFAFNGREAIDHYKKELPAIILMDLQMPVVDGFEAIAQIRQYEVESKISHSYIIALSAYSTNDEVEKAKQAGCDEYCVKPIKRQVLLDLLSKIKVKE